MLARHVNRATDNYWEMHPGVVLCFKFDLFQSYTVCKKHFLVLFLLSLACLSMKDISCIYFCVKGLMHFSPPS